jgi:hypothetical protein
MVQGRQAQGRPRFGHPFQGETASAFQGAFRFDIKWTPLDYRKEIEKSRKKLVYRIYLVVPTGFERVKEEGA